MSELRPLGASLELAGVERSLLFTLNAIEALEEHFDISLHDIIGSLVGQEAIISERAKRIRYILTVLLEDERKRELFFNKKELPQYTEEEVGWLITAEDQASALSAIVEAYLDSMPKKKGDEKNKESEPTK